MKLYGWSQNIDIKIKFTKNQIEASVLILKCPRKGFSINKMYHSHLNNSHAVFTQTYSFPLFLAEFVGITPKVSDTHYCQHQVMPGLPPNSH